MTVMTVMTVCILFRREIKEGLALTERHYLSQLSYLSCSCIAESETVVALKSKSYTTSEFHGQIWIWSSADNQFNHTTSCLPSGDAHAERISPLKPIAASYFPENPTLPVKGGC